MKHVTFVFDKPYWSLNRYLHYLHVRNIVIINMLFPIISSFILLLTCYFRLLVHARKTQQGIKLDFKKP